MKYAWTTDCHLDCLGQDRQRLKEFAESLCASNPEGIFITGDISTSEQLIFHLAAIESVVRRPVYFVLGNHDFYNADVVTVRKQMKEVTNMSQHLCYLPTKPYVALTQSTALIGHDGWYDAQHGDAANSTFLMNDWSQIRDFLEASGGHGFMSMMGRVKSMPQITIKARELAQECATHVHDAIKQAVRYHKNIVLLTHVPPFAESALHFGKASDPHAVPFYTNKILGDLLIDAARSYPTVSFTVLCGHTHSYYYGKHAKNLRVFVGKAEYNVPMLANEIDVT